MNDHKKENYEIFKWMSIICLFLIPIPSGIGIFLILFEIRNRSFIWHLAFYYSVGKIGLHTNKNLFKSSFKLFTAQQFQSSTSLDRKWKKEQPSLFENCSKSLNFVYMNSFFD
ncbi:hypothetical protein BKP45_08655 [Anaerobacillus alkalidiazotrophicus]|uniref:Uncharacterized protein n=1 Tax=Anaerobacillus alkalidiazotrophicus TaxID=472963 RepID=A0A1S2M877_9BACI|nr:hypothetical protein BKP45_08655 [Anaerobacillus alkalidiazotrophicus]